MDGDLQIISQWCSQKHFEYQDYFSEKEEITVVPGHYVCVAQRWHDIFLPDHCDDNEKESWLCECPCHHE